MEYESFESSYKEMTSFLSSNNEFYSSSSPPKDSSPSSKFDLLKMETVLMIITAASRNINLNLWFNLAKNNGLMSIPEFSNKLSSLVSAISIGEDEKIKKELELAISPEALNIIYDICLVEEEIQDAEDENKKIKKFSLVDVKKFLNYCFLKINHYYYDSNQLKKHSKTSEDEGQSNSYSSDDNEEEENFNESLKVFKNNILDFNKNSTSPSSTSEKSIDENESTGSTSSILDKASNNFSKEKLETDSDNYDDFFLNPNNNEPIQPNYSNFEEEDNIVSKENKINVNDITQTKKDDIKKKVGVISSTSSSLTCSNLNLKSNFNLINSNNKLELKKKLKKILKYADFYHFIQLYLGFLSPALHPSYIPNRGKIIFNKESQKFDYNAANSSENSYSTLTLPPHPPGLVSSSITSLHQNPQVVKSKNYRWIKISDIKEAFLYGNFSMNDYHLKLFKELMHDFSLIYDKLYVKKVQKIINIKEKDEDPFFYEEVDERRAFSNEDEEKAAEEKNSEENDTPRNYPPVFNGDKVHSEWLKKFLTHLRYAKEESVAPNNNLSSSIESIPPPPPTTSIILPSSAQPVSTEIIPLLWQEWLSQKLRKEIKINNNKNNFFNLFLYGNKKNFFYNFTSIESFNNLIEFILSNFSSNFNENQKYFKKNTPQEIDEKIKNNKENLERIRKNLTDTDSTSADYFEVLSLLKFNLLFYKDKDYYELLLQYNIEAWTLDIECTRNFQYHILKETERVKKEENKKKISEEEKEEIINNIMKKKFLDLKKNFNTMIFKNILINYFNYLLIENNTKKSSNVMNWFQFLDNEVSKLKKKIDNSKDITAISSPTTVATAFSSFTILKKELENAFRSIRISSDHKIMMEKNLNKLKLNGKKVTVSSKILENYKNLVKKKKSDTVDDDNDEYEDDQEFTNEEEKKNENLEDSPIEKITEFESLPIIIITKKSFYDEFYFLFNFYKLNIKSFDKFFESNIENLMIRICEEFKNEEIENKKRFVEWIKNKNKEKKINKKLEVLILLLLLFLN